MKPVLACLAGAASAFAMAANSAEVTVFKQPNFSGEQLTLRADTPNLAPQRFHDQASSLVLSGTWEFCSQPNYRGDCMTLGPGRYATLDPKLNHRIESARQVAGRGTEAGTSQVTLYKERNFGGATLALRQAAPNLATQGFHNQASSAVVTGGRWEFCSSPEGRGDCMVLEPGRYERLDQKIYHRMESARPVGDAWTPSKDAQRTALAQRDERRDARDDRREAREERREERREGRDVRRGTGSIDLYPAPDFRGRPLRLEQDVESLDGSRMDNQVSSLIVHDGVWQVCTRPGYEGRCRTYEPGQYPNLERMDDRIASLRQMR